MQLFCRKNYALRNDEEKVFKILQSFLSGFKENWRNPGSLKVHQTSKSFHIPLRND